MKLPKSIRLLVPFVALGIIGENSYAELLPTERLMKATSLTCTFISEQLTRWGASGALKEEGTILYRATFDLVNQRARVANAPWHEDETNITVRSRTFTHSITFFELTKSGALDPVITTVLDDYSSGTTKFIAVRSAHVTSAFQKALAIQDLGTCVPE